MQKIVRLAGAFVVLSAVAVVGSGIALSTSFVHRAFVGCRGGLQTVVPDEVGDRRTVVAPGTSELAVRYDERPGAIGDVRVVWARSDGPATCSEARVPWRPSFAIDGGSASPADLRLERDEVTGAYAVVRRAPGGNAVLTAFRRTNASGLRFVTERIEGPGVSLLVFAISLGALVMACWRLRRAWPYASRIRGWSSGFLRRDGGIEDANQTVLGRLSLDAAEVLAAVPNDGEAILVDPRVLDPDQAYREARVLGAGDVRVGTHALWAAATGQRLREACLLAALAAVATGATTAAVAARHEASAPTRTPAPHG